MRGARIKGLAGSYYHCVTRVVDKNRIFGDAEKETIRRMLWRVTEFSGIEVLTYAIMSNHLHLLIRVPEPTEIDDTELLRRLRLLYGRIPAHNIGQSLKAFREAGETKSAEALRAKYLYRMCDLSEFMKTLKQRISMWYNGTHHREGTLWEDRFKSVIVEGSRHALGMIAAYIDLNAVRAGIVSDPGRYRFCGYGEALGGSAGARAGLAQVMQSLERFESNWRSVSAGYRKFLAMTGVEQGLQADGKPTQAGLSTETVREVLARNGKLSQAELLHCRVRYFSDGVVLGSKAFVDGVFERYRDRFGPKRQDGGRKLRWGEWGGLSALRALRVDVIAAPGSG
jgi:REP element-mobilizing transposase RayT